MQTKTNKTNMTMLAGALARRIQDHENPSHYGSTDPAFVRLERNGTALLLIIAEGEKGANVTGDLPMTIFFDALLSKAAQLEDSADNGLRVFIHLESVKDVNDLDEVVKGGILLLDETNDMVNAWFDCIRVAADQSGSIVSWGAELTEGA